MSQHTKGKWVVDESRHDGCINVLEPFRHIGMVSAYQGAQGDREENEANARLMAAAPDLLEALQDLKREIILSDVDMDYIDSHFKQWLDKARAAIDKATINQ